MNNLSQAQNIVRQKNGWLKSHGLGNDYIVFNSDNIDFDFDKEKISQICNRNYGVGSDGILVLTESSKAEFGLKIYNPDGSEAEKSGNGIRIFVDYLYSMGYLSKTAFFIEVGGEIVGCEVFLDTNGTIVNIGVDIGKATFIPSKIPAAINKAEAIDFPLILKDEQYMFSAVSVGNPHAVCIVDDLSQIDIKKIGPLIENHAIFPNRTNVQFVQILDRENVQIEIWERGAGYTLASGSSSCGVVSVLYKKGFVDNRVSVHMPGGTLHVSISEDFKVRLLGPVTEVACGILF